MRRVRHSHRLVRLVPSVLVERAEIEPAHLGRVRLDAHAVHGGGGWNDDGVRREETFRLAWSSIHVACSPVETRVEKIEDHHVAPLGRNPEFSALEFRRVRARDGDARRQTVRGDASTRHRRERAVPFARDGDGRARPRRHHRQQPGPRADVQNPGGTLGFDHPTNLSRDGVVVRPRARASRSTAKWYCGNTRRVSRGANIPRPRRKIARERCCARTSEESRRRGAPPSRPACTAPRDVRMWAGSREWVRPRDRSASDRFPETFSRPGETPRARC